MASALVTPPSGDVTRLSLEALLAKVYEAHPDACPASITVGSNPSASAIFNLGRENTVFVNPYSGELLGGPSPLRHFLHEAVEWHRWFAMAGESRDIARAVAGACNLAFFWLAVTGVYLWRPRHWAWRGLRTSILFNTHLRGKARDWNWHNVIGFWSSAVLVILTLTGAVMPYAWASDLLYALTGSEPPARRAEGPGRAVQRGRGRAPAARGQTAGLDALLVSARHQVPGWVTINIRPIGGVAPVTASIQEPDAWNRFQRSQLALDGATARVIKWEPYAANSRGRKLRAWVRGLHTAKHWDFSVRQSPARPLWAAAFWFGPASRWHGGVSAIANAERIPSLSLNRQL